MGKSGYDHQYKGRCEENQFIFMANSGNQPDRISGLPLPLLHHILSFLPTHTVVRTCVLSKHWRDIWCSVPSLYLDQYLLIVQNIDFVKFVDSLLLLRDGMKIKKIRIYLIEGNSYDMSKVNTWILYALKHNVEAMEIDIVRTMKLTRRIFTCESLREFKLSFNKLSLPASICLPALRILHLRHVDVQDDILFSAIPSMETFIAVNTSFQDNKFLAISALQLKTLILKGKFPTSIEISAPNLISLELISFDQEFPQTIRFNSSLIHLIDANIQLPTSCFGSMIQLFSILENVHSLTLTSLFCKPFDAELEEELSTPERVETSFYNLKWLKIETSFSDSEILVINTILDRSPQIETIFLKNKVRKDGCDITTCEAEKVWFNYTLCHLKLVEIEGFRGSENEMKIVELFLENAIVLENLIITTLKSEEGTSKYDQEMMKTGRKLLKYPRASSSVGILFG